LSVKNYFYKHGNVIKFLGSFQEKRTFSKEITTGDFRDWITKLTRIILKVLRDFGSDAKAEEMKPVNVSLPVSKLSDLFKLPMEFP